ncbi:membrane bound O-acyl transferase family-domain-containing protein [Rhizoctonia solani]|nr:membrane bound O-acyl transferase family-domain-containing protein [Rhizoctonia solani]
MPDAENRRPLSVAALLIPSTIYLLVIYYASNKRLFPYRNIFVPIALFTIWETCTHYAILDPRFNVCNFFLGAAGCTLAMKLAAIVTLKHPLKRKSEVECPRSELFSFRQLIDAIDYSFDLRGLHWSFNKACHLPPETRATSTLFDFEVDTALVFIWTHIPFPFHGIPIPPFFTACFVTFLGGLMAYHALTAIHLFMTFCLAPFYSNPAKSWPPLFGDPLQAVSVHNFWSRQWHSVLRYGFCSTGGKLGWEVGGSIGAVLGVFFVSGLLHDFGLWCMGQGMEFRRVTMYFVLQGVVVLLEKTFEVDVWVESVEMDDADKINLKATITGFPKQTRTPRKNSLVDNGLGQLWTAFWVVVPATLMVDAGARRGFFGIPFNFPPWG